MVASGSDDCSVKIWDAGRKDCLASFMDYTDIINDVRFNPDGTCVASAGADTSIKIWDVRSSRILQHYNDHNDAVMKLNFHPSGWYLLSSSRDGTLKIWDLRQGHVLYSMFGHKGATGGVAFSRDGSLFASGGQDQQVSVWFSNLTPSKSQITTPLKSTKRVKTSTKPTPALQPQPQAAALEEKENVQSIPPELVQTVEKICSQMELVTRSLMLLEQRVTLFEDKFITMTQSLHKTDMGSKASSPQKVHSYQSSSPSQSP
jgi:centriolar protein POC1